MTSNAEVASTSPPPPKWWGDGSGGGGGGWGDATFPTSPAAFHLDSSYRLKGDSYPKAATQRNPLQVQLDMTGMVLHSCVAVLAHLSEKEARGSTASAAVDGEDEGEMGRVTSTDDYDGVAWRHFAPDLWQTALHCLMPDAPKPPTTLARVWARGFLRHPTLIKLADARFNLLGFDAGDETEPIPGTDVLVVQPAWMDPDGGGTTTRLFTRRFPAPPFAHALITDAVEAMLEPAGSCSNEQLTAILGDHGGTGRDEGVRWPALLAQMSCVYHDTALVVGRRMARALRSRYDIDVEKPLPRATEAPHTTTASESGPQTAAELPKQVKWQIAELAAKASDAAAATYGASGTPTGALPPPMRRSHAGIRMFGCPEDVDAALAYMVRGRHPAVVTREDLARHPNGAIVIAHLHL